MIRRRARIGPTISAVEALLAATLAIAISAPWASVEAQSPGTWETRQPLSTLRTEVGGAVVQGRLHVVGRYPGGTAPPGAHEAYDPVADAWTTLAPLPADLNHIAAVELDGSLYVAGGWT